MTRRHVLVESGIEYVSHACNFVEGCAHGCKYCYARTTKRVNYAEWCEPRVVPFAVALLEADLGRLKQPPTEIMISSSHDACQPDDAVLAATWDILTILADRDMPAWVLTKGGLRSWRFLDLLKRDNARFGVTITTHDEAERERWERGAATTRERLMALTNAKAKGLRTWASVEPILPGLDIARLVRQLQGIADWVVIGKWNYSTEAARMDWPRIRREAEEAFSGAGIPYLIKSELREAGAVERAA